MKKRPDTKRITLDAVLTATALVMFIVELQFPEIVPVPGVKPGLANIITLIAMFRLGPADAFAILIARILLGSMFSGRIISVIYSLAGGLLCFLVTLLLKKIVSEKQIGQPVQIHLSISGNGIAHQGREQVSTDI